MLFPHPFFFFFFLNDTATTEIYPLPLHDALPILEGITEPSPATRERVAEGRVRVGTTPHSPPRHHHSPPRARRRGGRSEEHTSELQSQSNLVCRLLLEKKKKQRHQNTDLKTPIHI